MSNRLQNAPVAALRRSAFGPLITADEMAALLMQPHDENRPYAPTPTAEVVGPNWAEVHDLRTPVASILALVEQLLREDRGNSEVQHVKRHAQHLLAMVDGAVVGAQASSGPLGAEFSSH